MNDIQPIDHAWLFTAIFATVWIVLGMIVWRYGGAVAKSNLVQKVLFKKQICPYCRSSIANTEARVCSHCRTALHEECWKENGGCCVFQCVENPKTQLHA